MPPSSVVTRKLMSETSPANPSLLRNPKCVSENSSKIQSSHGKVEEKKIIPTIPIDMIGIKGYDKRNTKEARQ